MSIMDHPNRFARFVKFVINLRFRIVEKIVKIVQEVKGNEQERGFGEIIRRIVSIVKRSTNVKRNRRSRSRLTMKPSNKV